ncbi:MAG: hypothetical protein M1819_001700 [Sarea resinae]|nr:MAG: hypothetical protein M1819_001700 [Sarea resinae]
MGDPPRFTVRPFSKPARTDLKDAFRVHLSAGALLQLRLRAGDPCRVLSVDGHGGPAIAWTAPEKIQDTLVQTSKVLQSIYKLKLGDKLAISKCDGPIDEASTVYLQDVTSTEGDEDGSEGSAEKSHWEWFLEYTLERAEYLVPGMAFENVELKGMKKAFKIIRIEGHNAAVPSMGIYRFQKGSRTKIQQQGTDESSAVQASSHSFVISPDGIGGLSRQVRQLNERLQTLVNDAQGLKMPSYYRRRGAVLLYGPAGTGKTLLLNKIAALSWRRVLHVDTSIIGRYTGDSESSIRKIFTEAVRNQPSIIIMDQLEAIATKGSRSESPGMSNIALALAAELDKLEGTRVFVVAATRKPNEIDEALRTPGRLQYEIEIPIPDANARIEILKSLRGLPSSDPDGMSEALGERTHGYVGADLDAVVQLAAEKARSRYIIQGSPELDAEGRVVEVQQDDYENALVEVRPTAMREVFLEAPKVRWSDIGGQEEVKQHLREVVEWPFKYPERMRRLNIDTKKGLLLYGPPGCSKTLTAKALATEAGLNFIAVKGAELISMYVGESERALREVFRKARAASPSIVFFDEIDAIAGTRDGGAGGGGGGGGQHSGLNVLTTLLNEMDGIEALKGVLVLAATNKPEVLDPALMRPGRLDTILYVGPPDLAARREILRIKTRAMDVGADVDVDELAARTDGYSGAEIVSICERAGYAAFGECERDGTEVAICERHFALALDKVQRQISALVRARYENWSVGGARKL